MAETTKAVENFQVSGEPIPRHVARWLGRIKAAAARVNADLGLLDAEKAERIAAAGDRIANGELDDQFPIDVFQTGSGTSSNMNANEVIAALAGEGVHANDDVNMGQSSNDVFPSAVHLAALEQLTHDLVPALDRLAQSLEAKASEFDDVVKSGRTHLMDAVPVTLGQEFGGYAAQVRQGIARIEATLERVGQIPLGGTAVGTGLNTHPEFAERVRARLSEETGLTILAAGRSVRGPGGAGRARRGVRRDEGRRGLADQDRERPPADGLGPAGRPRRDRAARAPEGQLDHARQGQPGHPRGRHAGRRAGDRKRRGDHGRRHAGPLRAERLRAGDRAQPPRLGPPARRPPRASSPRSASTASRPTARPASTTPSSRSPPRPRSTRTSATTRRPRSSRKPPPRAGRCREVAREAGVDEETLDKALDYRAMAEPHDKGRASLTSPAR